MNESGTATLMASRRGRSQISESFVGRRREWSADRRQSDPITPTGYKLFLRGPRKGAAGRSGRTAGSRDRSGNPRSPRGCWPALHLRSHPGRRPRRDTFARENSRRRRIDGNTWERLFPPQCPTIAGLRLVQSRPWVAYQSPVRFSSRVASPRARRPTSTLEPPPMRLMGTPSSTGRASRRAITGR